MVRIAVFSACTLLVISQASAACNYISDRSVVFVDNTIPVCEDVFESASVLITDTLNWSTTPAALDESIGKYWEQWAFQKKETPILTKNLKKNHFGLGIWMPEDLMEEESKMNTEEWLLSHGLLFSVGFGNKGDGEPRMRFDYRWHDSYDADWMMQIELPF